MNQTSLHAGGLVLQLGITRPRHHHVSHQPGGHQAAAPAGTRYSTIIITNITYNCISCCGCGCHLYKSNSACYSRSSGATQLPCHLQCTLAEVCSVVLTIRIDIQQRICSLIHSLVAVTSSLHTLTLLCIVSMSTLLAPCQPISHSIINPKTPKYLLTPQVAICGISSLITTEKLYTLCCIHARSLLCYCRYVYLFPLRGAGSEGAQLGSSGYSASQPAGTTANSAGCSNDWVTEPCAAAVGHATSLATACSSLVDATAMTAASSDARSLEAALAVDHLDVDPAKVDQLLQQLQGKTLEYYAFGRDTAAGKDCVCTLHVARATVVTLPPATAAQLHSHDDHSSSNSSCSSSIANSPARVLCIEMVGNRFIRR